MEAKKNPDKDLRKKRSVFLTLGLLVSISIVFSAFEWKTVVVVPQIEFENDGYTIEDEPPATVHVTPPPPPPPPKEIAIIETEEEPPVKVDISELFPDINEPIDAPSTVIEQPPVEIPDEIFMVVEEQAYFSKDEKAWSKFLHKNLKYPKKAQRMGIEGRVFLSFVVDTDGTLSDIKVIRGIGGGCDEEAIRVLELSPNWHPGKQRTVAVKSRMSLQIQFRLK